MRKFLLISILFTGLKSNAQFDTSYISRVFEYTSTAEFRKAYCDSIGCNIKRDITPVKERKKKRKKEAQWPYSFIKPRIIDSNALSQCFMSSSEYLVPDRVRLTNTSLLDGDTLYRIISFKKGGEYIPKIYSPSPGVCKDTLAFECRFLARNIIELTHFYGMARFGTQDELCFKINPDMSVSFIRYRVAIYH